MHGSLEMQGSLISIHASAKEATQTKSAATTAAKFQSTPPRRRRPPQQMQQQSNPDISIHVSAKEATESEAVPNKKAKISIHASAKEATKSIVALSPLIVFQSTPPRRRRLSVAGKQLGCQYFNPRLREGGDAAQLAASQASQFQSTPPRRRRR